MKTIADVIECLINFPLESHMKSALDPFIFVKLFLRGEIEDEETVGFGQ